MNEPWPQRRSETNPANTPHLHVRTVEGVLGEAIAITGNAKALLQLPAQIDRALRDETSFPFEESVYVDVTPFEVAVKRARSGEEMQEPAPKPERTTEQLPWATRTKDAPQPAAESDEG
jgi:hypothetical protein